MVIMVFSLQRNTDVIVTRKDKVNLSQELALNTREGLGLGLPLGFSDGLELRLRSQFGAAVWRDVGINVQTSDKCYIVGGNARANPDARFVR